MVKQKLGDGVTSRSKRTKLITKCGKVHCDWFILLLLLLTLTFWFSLDHKWNEATESKAQLEEYRNVLLLPTPIL